MRSLKGRWGEARSGEGVSTKSVCWILLDAWLGRFIYTQKFRVVRVKSASCILIGPESGGLWVLWAQEDQGMLHWGTPDWPADSKPISWKRRILIGRWPRPGRCAGFWKSRIPIGWWPKLGRWVAEPAVQDAKFSLANSPGCFFLRRRGRNLRGSLREASCGGVFSWFSEGAGEVRSPCYRVGGWAGSGTQFRYLSQGGRVTIYIYISINQ